jgi:hypothetical protein
LSGSSPLNTQFRGAQDMGLDQDMGLETLEQRRQRRRAAAASRAPADFTLWAQLLK